MITTARRKKYLRGDGTWQTPPDTTYTVATTTANGLMSSADKTKLDGIDPDSYLTDADLEAISTTEIDALFA